MVKNNKKCLVCGAVYSYCGSCAEYRHLPTWMTTFHSDNCRRVFNIVSSYNAGSLSKEDALIRLNDCDLTDKNKYSRKVSEVIDEIRTAKVETIGEMSQEVKEVVEEISDTEDTTPAYNTYSKKSKKSKYKN